MYNKAKDFVKPSYGCSDICSLFNMVMHLRLSSIHIMLYHKLGIRGLRQRMKKHRKTRNYSERCFSITCLCYSETHPNQQGLQEAYQLSAFQEHDK